jgi:hypothetical protein
LFFSINFIAAGLVISLTIQLYGAIIDGLDGIAKLSDSVQTDDAEEQ